MQDVVTYCDLIKNRPTFETDGRRGHSNMGGRPAARRERTHDVRCPVREAKVIPVDAADAFRDAQLLLATEDAAIGGRLAPQHHCDNADLTRDQDVTVNFF